jgi:hypothetical protein
MLPTAWLLCFESIHAMDIDPFARWLFAWRHGSALKAAGVRWHYQTGDAVAELPRLLTAHPRACVLLDNLLGQLRFHAPAWQDPTVFTGLQLRKIERLLHGREWGSVHDLLSGPADGLAAEQAFPAARNAVMAPGHQRQTDVAWLSAASPKGEWLDHLTGQVFPPGTPVQDIGWAFSTDYWHWLQAGWVQSPSLSAEAVPDLMHGRLGWDQLPLLQHSAAFDHRATGHGTRKHR